MVTALLEVVARVFPAMSEDMIISAFYHFLHFLLGFLFLLWTADLVHRYGTDSTKTRPGWARWLATRLSPLVRLDYRASFWAILLALTLGVVLAWAEGPVHHVETGTRLEQASTRPVTRGYQTSRAQAKTILTARELMDFAASGATDVVQSHVGLSIEVHGEFFRMEGSPSLLDAERDWQPGPLATQFTIVLERDKDFEPERVVYAHLDPQNKHDIAAIAIYPNWIDLTVSGIIQNVDGTSLTLTEADIFDYD